MSEAQTTTRPETDGADVALSLTDKAVAEISKICEAENLGKHLLRISVVGGGCSGMQYKMGFVETVNEHDQVVEKGGVRVVVDPKSGLYLAGTVVDFTDGLNGKGFTFNNPKATRTCGCGSSFSA
jgi:iron-sulfur cluster assembly protein